MRRTRPDHAGGPGVVGLVASVLVLGLLSACGSSTGSTEAPETTETTGTSPSASATVSDQSASPTPSASASASASPTTTASALATSTPVPLPSSRPLVSRLLSATDLPGFNDEWQWQLSATRPSAARAFGRCARFDLVSIGALEGVTRTYVEDEDPGSTNRAAMQVAEFPDPKTAARAASVLASWHRSCAERLPPDRSPEVTPLEKVPVAAGTGSWYLVITTPPGSDDGHFHAFGLVRNGTRMALLTMDNDGQDRSYARGRDPMQLAVAAAAKRLR